MIAKQYSFVLPADYDMAIIDLTVRNRQLANAGIGGDAFAVTEGTMEA